MTEAAAINNAMKDIITTHAEAVQRACTRITNEEMTLADRNILLWHIIDDMNLIKKAVEHIDGRAQQ